MRKTKITEILMIPKEFLYLFIFFITLSCSKKEPTKVKSSSKSITTFHFNLINPPIKASIDSVLFVITATVPNNVDITNLAPTINISNKANVSPISGKEQDFTKPINYLVKAEDGSSQSYTVILRKINYLCESNNLPSYNHQFGLKLDDKTIFCSAFREKSPSVNTDGELEMYYLFNNFENKCCAGVIYFKTIGFKRLGKSPLKILKFSAPNSDVIFENFNNNSANGVINIISINNGLVNGEFESEITYNGSSHKIYGNFKDVPIINI